MKLFNLFIALLVLPFSSHLTAFESSDCCEADSEEIKAHCFHLNEDESQVAEKPWYSDYYRHTHTVDPDPAYQLDKDATWPNQREEFSDTLLR